MKILYLHGLDTKPNSNKILILQNMGHSVKSPFINYRQFENDISLFNGIIEEIQNSNINFIVGSSFGGYIGFYASEYTRIPALLFNPALSIQNCPVPVINNFSDTPKKIILGKNDNIINPNYTKYVIKNNNYTNTKLYEWDFEHQVSLEIFEKAIKLI